MPYVDEVHFKVTNSLTLHSRNPQRLLFRPGGSAQHPGHRPARSQFGRSLRPLQPEILRQDCRDGCEANGEYGSPCFDIHVLTLLAFSRTDDPREEPDLPRHQARQLPHWPTKLESCQRHSRR